MTEEYEFCDHCIKDITNRRKIVKEGFNQVFCSRDCRTNYYNEEENHEDDFIMKKCYECENMFPLGQLTEYNICGYGLCGNKCQSKFIKDTYLERLHGRLRKNIYVSN